MRMVAEKLEEAGYLIVARADVHALRAAADKVLRFTPAQSWCVRATLPTRGGASVVAPGTSTG
jgi:hypothetical protein